MPLIKSATKQAVGENIRREKAAGKPHKQAIAIALDIQRRAKARKYALGGEISPWDERPRNEEGIPQIANTSWQFTEPQREVILEDLAPPVQTAGILNSLIKGTTKAAAPAAKVTPKIAPSAMDEETLRHAIRKAHRRSNQQLMTIRRHRKADEYQNQLEERIFGDRENPPSGYAPGGQVDEPAENPWETVPRSDEGIPQITVAPWAIPKPGATMEPTPPTTNPVSEMSKRVTQGIAHEAQDYYRKNFQPPPLEDLKPEDSTQKVKPNQWSTWNAMPAITDVVGLASPVKTAPILAIAGTGARRVVRRTAQRAAERTAQDIPPSPTLEEKVAALIEDMNRERSASPQSPNIEQDIASLVNRPGEVRPTPPSPGTTTADLEREIRQLLNIPEPTPTPASAPTTRLPPIFQQDFGRQFFSQIQSNAISPRDAAQTIARINRRDPDGLAQILWHIAQNGNAVFADDILRYAGPRLQRNTRAAIQQIAEETNQNPFIQVRMADVLEALKGGGIGPGNAAAELVSLTRGNARLLDAELRRIGKEDPALAKSLFEHLPPNAKSSIAALPPPQAANRAATEPIPDIAAFIEENRFNPAVAADRLRQFHNNNALAITGDLQRIAGHDAGLAHNIYKELPRPLKETVDREMNDVVAQMDTSVPGGVNPLAQSLAAPRSIIRPQYQWMAEHQNLLPEHLSDNTAQFLNDRILPNYGMKFDEFTSKYFNNGYTPRGTVFQYTPGRLHIANARLRNANGDTIGAMERTIYTASENPHAHHGYLRLYDNVQGQGFTKKLLSNQMDLYEKLNLKYVDVYASLDRGAYAWARYGFVPSRVDWNFLSQRLRTDLDRLAQRGAILRDDANDLLEPLRRQNPKAFWDFVDNRASPPIGSYGNTASKPRTWPNILLENQSWSGKLDIRDPETMRRFNNYVRR